MDRNSKTELLAVSFGTTSEESRRLNIDAVEKRIEEVCGLTVRRAFTSQMIINIIAKREGVRIDNVREALERAVSDGVKRLVVQPTHLMSGLEYDKLKGMLDEYPDQFERTALGEPLLTGDEDFAGVAGALVGACAEYDDGETAVVLMGHGTEAAANGIYDRMQETFARMGKKNFFVGTVEASPSLDDVIAETGKGDYRRVVLRPLMLVAGNHAVNDMADPDDPESWYSRFTAAGYETVCIIEGLGQIAAVRDIYADHAYRAIANLDL